MTEVKALRCLDRFRGTGCHLASQTHSYITTAVTGQHQRDEARLGLRVSVREFVNIAAPRQWM